MTAQLFIEYTSVLPQHLQICNFPSTIFIFLMDFMMYFPSKIHSILIIFHLKLVTTKNEIAGKLEMTFTSGNCPVLVCRLLPVITGAWFKTRCNFIYAPEDFIIRYKKHNFREIFD